MNEITHKKIKQRTFFSYIHKHSGRLNNIKMNEQKADNIHKKRKSALNITYVVPFLGYFIRFVCNINEEVLYFIGINTSVALHITHSHQLIKQNNNKCFCCYVRKKTRSKKNWVIKAGYDSSSFHSTLLVLISSNSVEIPGYGK